MKNRVLIASVVCLVLAAGAAGAEEKFGIAVYPGARSDDMTKKNCGFVDRSGKTAQCFRTSDDFSKVYAFYQKQANLVPPDVYQAMPPDMKKDMIAGPLKSVDLCRKGTSELCGMGAPPAVRITSPWTIKPNISPAAKAAEYENKDVLIMITSY